MTKIGTPTRAALLALAVLLALAPHAQAKRWNDEEQAPRYEEDAPREGKGNRQRYESAPRDDNGTRYESVPRDDRGPRYESAPRDNNRSRDYYEPREQPSRSPGISLDRAVGQASREGRVLSADEVDGGYRIKVLTPQGRVRVLYYGGGR